MNTTHAVYPNHAVALPIPRPRPPSDDLTLTALHNAIRFCGFSDPGHTEHQDMLDRLDLDNRSRFDPTRFATDQANRRLTAVSHAGPRVSRH
jgi:hypothetical protein